MYDGLVQNRAKATYGFLDSHLCWLTAIRYHSIQPNAST